MVQKKLQEAVKKGGELLFNLMRSLTTVEDRDARYCGVTISQAMSLMAMGLPDGATMGRVTEALDVSAGTATRVVDNLVRDGLVERFENPRDRRSVCVCPTAKGRKTIGNLEECYSNCCETIFGAIPAGKLPATLEVLELLVEAVRKARETCCPTFQPKSGKTHEGETK